MVSQVVFTERATKHLASISSYIEGTFGVAAVNNFGHLLLSSLNALQLNPEIGSFALVAKRIRKLVIHKRCILFYRHLISQDVIQIIDIWDTRLNPTKRKL